MLSPLTFWMCLDRILSCWRSLVVGLPTETGTPRPWGEGECRNVWAGREDELRVENCVGIVAWRILETQSAASSMEAV